MPTTTTTTEIVTDTEAVRIALNAALAGPKVIEGDAGKVEQHSIADLIAADRYLRTTTDSVGTGARRGLRFTKLNPPGTV